MACRLRVGGLRHTLAGRVDRRLRPLRPARGTDLRRPPRSRRLGYAGEYTDPTGYLYLRASRYDPQAAQFLTRDPLEATTANPYGYTDGNPLQYTDPLGLDWLQDAGDWSAAFGDTITLGGTKWVRGKLGVDDAVNYCSTFYTWGGVGGGLASLVPIGAGAVGGARAAGWVAQRVRVSRVPGRPWHPGGSWQWCRKRRRQCRQRHAARAAVGARVSRLGLHLVWAPELRSDRRFSADHPRQQAGQ